MKLILGLILTTFLAAPSALARVGEMRVGSFIGLWCGYEARFDLAVKTDDAAVFEGEVLILLTGEYDPIRIEQFGDGSLKAVRYLSAAHHGLTQTVYFYPPQGYVYGDVVFDRYVSRTESGFNCTPTSKILVPRDADEE